MNNLVLAQRALNCACGCYKALFKTRDVSGPDGSEDSLEYAPAHNQISQRSEIEKVATDHRGTYAKL